MVPAAACFVVIAERENVVKRHAGSRAGGTVSVKVLAAQAALLVGLAAWAASRAADAPQGPVKSAVTLMNPGVKDQDDMCFWKHPDDPAKSIVITSDKYGNRLWVYDLEGKLLQEVAAAYPGNIDTRTGFTLGGEKIDIVVHNQRTQKRYMLKVYKVDPAERKLVCVDNGNITTGMNYGGCLYRSAKTGKFYFFTTSKQTGIEQIELFDDGGGKVAGRKVRSWPLGMCEGAVADDEAGLLFVAEERRGIWSFDAEADAKPEGKLVARVGQNGLARDVEGLTIMPTGDKEGFLIASSQGNNTFKVYKRAAPHEFVGTFSVAGAVETDGIDVMAGDFGEAFPEGIFACHRGRDQTRCPVLLASWKDVAAALGASESPGND